MVHASRIYHAICMIMAIIPPERYVYCLERGVEIDGGNFVSFSYNSVITSRAERAPPPAAIIRFSKMLFAFS